MILAQRGGRSQARRSVPGTVIAEGGLFIVGVWLHVAGTRSRDRIGTIGLWAFIALVTLIYIGNLAGRRRRARAPSRWWGWWDGVPGVGGVD